MKIFNFIKSRFEKEAENKTNPQDLITQLTTYRSPLYTQSYIEPYNPDDLIRRKGISIYEKMMNDEQIKATLEMKKSAVLASGWNILSDGQSDDDKSVLEFTKTVFNKINVQQLILDLLTALEYGYSVIEKIVEYDKKTGKWIYKKLCSKPPHGFYFNLNEFGELVKIEQEQTKGLIPIPREKLIIFSYNSEFGNIYGNSDLRAAYRAWWSKDCVIKFWNIFNERFGVPTVIGRHPRGATKDEKSTLFNIIKHLQAKTTILAPENFNFEFKEVSKTGSETFESAVKQYNAMITRALLMPEQLGFGDTAQGSYAKAGVHLDLYSIILGRLRADIEEVIFNEVIKSLIDWNFSNIEFYPYFKFKPILQEDKKAINDQFILAVKEGIIKSTENDESHLRDSLNFPERKYTADVPSVEPIERKVEAQPSGIFPFTKSSFAVSKLRRGLTEYEKGKMNFEKINKELSNTEINLSVELSKLFFKIREDVLYFVKKKKIIDDKNIKEIDNISLKYLVDIKQTFKQFLMIGYNDGRKTANDEIKIKRSNYVKPSAVLVPKAAIEFFNQYSFFLTGTERDYILKNVKAILMNGIQYGETSAEVNYKLEQFFDKYEVLQKMPNGELERIEDIPGRIETISRTNISTAFNEGRYATFQDDDVKEIIPAYQYSAILDTRVTDFCEKQDGRIYAAADPIWTTIKPPNHFNCRSTIVPVFSDEKYEVSKHLAIHPAEGFGVV